MTDYFTQLLEKKCKDEDCMILYSEWLREKEMAIRILSNVSNMSSHFSIHDHTHSEAILKHIKGFLGKKVVEKEFTATDLWMLLFAAYYHDIGMVVISSAPVTTTTISQKFWILMIEKSAWVKVMLTRVL